MFSSTDDIASIGSDLSVNDFFVSIDCVLMRSA